MNLSLPYAGEVYISSAYGYRDDPLTRDTVFHSGLDLVGVDSKKIIAPCDGIVAVSTIITDEYNRTSEWGNYIRIDTDDGYNVYMCHLAERYAKVGDSVKFGDEIALEGSTGRSTGSHCHFEVRKNGQKINPCSLIGIENRAEIIVKNEVNNMQNITYETHDWSEEAVMWAVDNGIIYGDENGNLMLDKPCTREQMMVFLHRLYSILK